MTKGLEPVFPNVAFDQQGQFTHNLENRGISTRLYLAGMAMQGLMVQAIPDRTNRNTIENNRERAQFALAMADELLKQEEATR
ncbi:MAG: hypothetical protein WCX46_04345 [Candidatus Paceibacterota bacterium]